MAMIGNATVRTTTHIVAQLVEDQGQTPPLALQKSMVVGEINLPIV